MDGYGAFASCVRTGFDDLASNPDLLLGRAFIIHSEDASRVSCGLIENAASNFEATILTTELVPIPGTTSTSAPVGTVSVLANLDDRAADGVCYLGYATSLQPNVESFLLNSGSDQCSVKNGCGAHIHSGTGCENTDVQGGHYFDESDIVVDPWLLESYLETSSDGAAALVGCVITGDGATEYDSRPFIVHGTFGGRLFCGLLEDEGSESEDVEIDIEETEGVRIEVDENTDVDIEVTVEEDVVVIKIQGLD